jgi:hypothetical protein
LRCVAPYLSQKRIIRASIELENADNLARDLDQSLYRRTLRGMVGPLAYKVLKKK